MVLFISGQGLELEASRIGITYVAIVAIGREPKCFTALHGVDARQQDLCKQQAEVLD